MEMLLPYYCEPYMSLTVKVGTHSCVLPLNFLTLRLENCLHLQKFVDALSQTTFAHLSKNPHFIQKFTNWNYQFSQNSHSQHLMFNKIHIFSKITFLKSHIWQNSHLWYHFLTKFTFSTFDFGQNSPFSQSNFSQNSHF